MISFIYSRYTAMKPSTEVDSKDLESYPDPLSINYDDLTTTEVPSVFEMDYSTLQKPYQVCAALYGNAQYDDIVLSWNEIPHLSKMAAGDLLYFPVLADIISFIRKNQ